MSFLTSWHTPFLTRCQFCFCSPFQYNPDNATVTISFHDLGYKRGTTATVRDLYARKDVGVFTDSFSYSIGSYQSFVGNYFVLSLLTFIKGKITPNTMHPYYINWRPWHTSRIVQARMPQSILQQLKPYDIYWNLFNKLYHNRSYCHVWLFENCL